MVMDMLERRFCNELDDKSKNKSIVCIKTIEVEEKELALNHMINKGWVCVQNDCCSEDDLITFILTFATKDAAASFKV